MGSRRRGISLSRKGRGWSEVQALYVLARARMTRIRRVPLDLTMEAIDSCTEWMFSYLESFLKGRPRLWLRDPDRLLSSDPSLIQPKITTEEFR
jgi:hypothetical protein